MIIRKRTHNPQEISACTLVHLWPKFLFVFFLCSFEAIPSFASLEWETTSKNITVHPLQTSATIEYNFINISSDSVTIIELKPSCGCTSGSVDKVTYAPTESGTVYLTFNLEKREGAQRKGISIKTSDSPTKPVMLYVSTNIHPTYKFSVKRLTWVAGENRAPKSCRITNAHEASFRLAKAVPAREGVEVELKPIREGYEYELVVTPSLDLKNTLIPISIHPEIPDGLTKVRIFTIYALLK